MSVCADKGTLSSHVAGRARARLYFRQSLVRAREEGYADGTA